MWGIQEVAKLAGTTSRTLRYYDAQGLLAPTEVGSNGYRYYDQAALIRLQRILALRQMGMGLAQIRDVLAGQTDDLTALREHAQWLAEQQTQLTRQLATVNRTIRALEEGENLMPEDILDGFNHEQYQLEVEQRWGRDAYATSDTWWRGLDDDSRRDFTNEGSQLATDWQAAFATGAASDSPSVQGIAARQYRWIVTAWGGVEPSRDQLIGLADMYVADDRFTANFGGTDAAAYVRAALVAFAMKELPSDEGD